MTVTSKDNPTSNDNPFESDAFSFEEELTHAVSEPQPAVTATVKDEQTEKSRLLDLDDIFSFDDTSGFPQEENPFSLENKLSSVLADKRPAVAAAVSAEQPEKTQLNDLDALFLLGDASELTAAEPITLPVEGKAVQPEISRYMDCICPKCSGRNNIEFALVPEKGLITACSSCGKKIQVIKESVAVRAKRKSSEINCSTCGKHLDHNCYCPSCGVLFPDFFTTLNPSDARRKARSDSMENRWAAIKGLNFSFRSGSGGSASALSYGYSATARTAGGAGKVSRRAITLSIVFVILAASAAAGLYFYNSYTSAKLYTENYFKLLYCMKTGIDSNLSRSAAMKADWDTALQSGRNFSPTVSIKDETKSVRFRGEIDKLLQAMSDPPPPSKFELANAKLMEIKKIYLESESLMKTRPASSQELGIRIETLTSKMGKAAVDLKSNIPDELKQELQTAKLKYRGLKDF